MVKFDMGAAWDDTLQLLKSHTALVGTIAGVFLFLPALAVAWFGPVPIEPAAGADFNQVMETFRESFRQMIPGQLAIALSALIGTAGILRLWLSRTGTSVGEALTFALMLFPTMLAIQILCGIAIGLGFILLLVPGLYLLGRLALVAPAVADRSLYNPFEAIRTSWDLTRGNGWAIFFFLFLVALVIIGGYRLGHRGKRTGVRTDARRFHRGRVQRRRRPGVDCRFGGCLSPACATDLVRRVPVMRVTANNNDVSQTGRSRSGFCPPWMECESLA